MIVVVPVFNEAANICAVLEDLRQNAGHLDRVVINDGSTDGTGRLVRAAKERVIDVPVNLGYGKVLHLGLRYMLAREYDAVVFFDGDGQHSAAQIDRLIDTLRTEEVALAIGSRFVESQAYSGPKTRRAAQRWFSWLTRPLLGRRIFDTTSGLKALTAGAAEQLVRGTFLDFHIEAIVRLRMFGYAIAEVPIEARERREGESMYSLLAALKYPLKTTALTLVAVMDGLLSRQSR